jgi:geranylgeranyl pyrophosphate synthase
MGGGTPQTIEALRAFGEAFGIAFQMKDDLLDVTADERSIGKPAANDLAEHKTTLPLIAALAAGGAGFRSLVDAFYGQPNGDALAAVLAGIERTGGVAATQTEIGRYAEKAKHALEPIEDGAAKRELARLTNALLS